MSQPDRPIAFGVDSLAGAKQPQGEAEGEKGSKTRTWFSLPDQPVFAVAGIWRDTDECGPAYSMVMTEACVHVADVPTGCR
jgi:putative SOS response-associated peptidase YedK